MVGLIASQGLYAGTNLLLMVALARSLDAADFAVAATLHLAVQSLVVIVRAGVLEPMFWAEHEHAGQRQRAAVAVGVVVTTGSVVAALIVPRGDVVAAMALVVVPILYQDAVRQEAFATGRQERAAVADGAWLTLFVVMWGLLEASANATVLTLTAAWSVSAVAGVGLSRRRHPATSRPSSERGIARPARRSVVVAPLLVDQFVAQAFALAAVMLAAAPAGLVALAGLRGAQVLLGPARLASVVLRTEVLTRWGRKAPPAATVLRVGLGSAVSVVVAGAVLMLAPASVFDGLLGESGRTARAVLPWVVLAQAFSTADVPVTVHLRIVGRHVALMAARVLGSVVGLGTLAGLAWARPGSEGPALALGTALVTVGLYTGWTWTRGGTR